MACRLSKRLIGSVVEVVLLDHNTNGAKKELSRCWVIGRVVRIDGRMLSLCYWRAEHEPALNNELHNLIRSAIESVRVIGE